MKYLNTLAATCIFMLFASTLHAAAKQEQKVLSGSTACHARILSKNSVVLPNHCLENDLSLTFVELGSRSISRVDRKSPYRGIGSESLVTVELHENIFTDFGRLDFGSPATGRAMVRSSKGEHNCRILTVDSSTRTFTHDCARFQGESGRTIYQQNKPVGLHLGHIRSTGAYIAAMKDGPDFTHDLKRFESYEAQGLKISCCKNLEKAIDKVGDAISDGAEAVKDFASKTAENIKAEITRVKNDIAILPKVFSVEYVQNRLPEVKLPKLPTIEMNQGILNGGQFKWDMPTIKLPNLATPKIGENHVLNKIRESIDKGLDDTGKALTKAGQDIGRWWPDTLKWIRSKTKGTSDCNSDGIPQLEECISDLEADIRENKLELKRLRGGAVRWVDDQRATIGL